MSKFWVVLFCCVQTAVFAQVGGLGKVPQKNSRDIFTEERDELNARDAKSANIKEFERPPVTDYKIISISRDTTYVDTTLTIHKDYKFNYLRKDRYGLLPFANTGQTYNTLVENFDKQRIMPGYIAKARHFGYMEVADIMYYHTPTPLTELYYRSAFEQGQQLDAHFTMNLHPRLNIFIAYKGVRSLGKYQHALTSTGNFRFGGSYNTTNKRYYIKTHWAVQNILNQENGGLTPLALSQFASGDEEIDDRSRLEVNYEDAESVLDGTRVYINHHYNIIQKKDSLKNYALRVGHIFNSENKFFTFSQENANDRYGDVFRQLDFTDRTDNEETYNEINAVYEDAKLGQLKFQANATYYNYGYKTILLRGENDNQIPNGLQGTTLAVGGGYKNSFGDFNIEGNAQVNFAGDFEGYNIFGEAGYALDDTKQFTASILSNASPAAYNHLLFQSNYINYNWFNQASYTTVKTNTLAAQLESDQWLNLKASATTINDYAYFGLQPLTEAELEENPDAVALVTSKQADEVVNHLKLTANKNFKYRKFNFDLTATYQNVSGAEEVLNVPDFVTRGSLYFTDRIFKNALFLQTGITANYFSNYTMNAYDPILGEFYVQNTEKIGNFPMFDFFVNLKVRQTRIFVKAEHFNSSFTGNNFYSAPDYPYRDFNVRFGIVWNFFL